MRGANMATVSVATNECPPIVREHCKLKYNPISGWLNSAHPGSVVDPEEEGLPN